MEERSVAFWKKEKGQKVPLKFSFLPPLASLLFIFSNYAWLGRAWRQQLASVMTIVSGFKLQGQCTNGINRIYNCCSEDRMCLHSLWGSSFKPNTQKRQTSKAQHGVPKAGEYKQNIFLIKCKFEDFLSITTQLSPSSRPESVTTAHWYAWFGWQAQGHAWWETHNNF